MIDWYIEGKGPEQGLDKVEAFRKTGKNITVVKNDKFDLPWKDHVD